MKRLSEYLKAPTFILTVICIFALCLRLWLFFVLQPWNEQVVENKVLACDSWGYNDQAVNIMSALSFYDFGSWRTPAYPLFIAFIYFLFGVKPWIVLLLQIFMDTGIVIIVYFIAREIFKSKAPPLIAAFLYALSFPSAYYSIILLSETPFTFIFALSVLIFIKGLKQNRPADFALTGLLIGVANLIRPVTLYFPPVIFLVILCTGNRLIIKLRNMSIVLALFLITMSPWQFRNLIVYGHYSLTSRQGANLCDANVALVKARIENISREEATKRLLGDSLAGVTDPFEESKIMQRIGLAYIYKHPVEYAKIHLEGIVRMFLGTTRSGLADLFGMKAEPPKSTESFSESKQRVIDNIRNELPNLILFLIQALEYIFVLIGLIAMSLKKDEKIYLFLLALIILYFANITGVIGYARFRVPIIPFILVISAAGIFETFKFIGRKYS